MARYTAFAVFTLVAFAAIAEAGNGGAASGNNAIRAAKVGTTYMIEGDRNSMAADATVNAINIAVNKGKAFLAATTGTKAALTASDRSVNIKTYDSLSKGGRKMLSHASGNNNNNNNNKVFSVEGGRNQYAQLGTADVIARAAENGKAFFASSFGKQAALATSQRSASGKAFDASTGARHLLGGSTNDRSDRVTQAASVTADIIESSVTSAAIKKATAGGIKFAKLAGQQSTRVTDFAP